MYICGAATTEKYFAAANLLGILMEVGVVGGGWWRWMGWRWGAKGEREEERRRGNNPEGREEVVIAVAGEGGRDGG